MSQRSHGAPGLGHPYTEDFYGGQERNRSSAQVIVPLVVELVRPRSVVDVGCGVGTWLSVFREHGVESILGVDGDWVPRHRLQIPTSSFRAADLTAPLRLDRRFDLAVSLEVAEHLPAASSQAFVESLTGLAPVVLFSAAIPFQGGDGHVNEQWPAYWAERFAARGYAPIDCIRRQVWTNKAVVSHYSQNLLLFARRDHLEADARLAREAEATGDTPLSLVHPEFYLMRAEPRNLALDPGRMAEYSSLSLMMVLPMVPALARKAIAGRLRRLGRLLFGAGKGARR